MIAKSQGFTLIELLVVLVILVLGYGAISYGLSSGRDTVEIKTTAYGIASALRYARGQALLNHQDQQVSFDLEKNYYDVSGHKGIFPIPDGITLSLVTAQSELTDQQRGSIRFFADGSSTGGRVTLARPTARWQIDINWLTGQVELSDVFDDQEPQTQ